MIDHSRYLGKPVQSLQTMLRHISDLDPRVLPVIPDGHYGPNTYASVRSFQEAYGLPVTGQTDQQTWDAISAVHNQLLPQLTVPVIVPVCSTGQTIYPGQSNYHLYLVQAMLAALSHFFPQLERTQLTGILDPATETGLLWIQKASGIPETGALNTETWHYLNGLYRTMTGEGNTFASDKG